MVDIYYLSMMFSQKIMKNKNLLILSLFIAFGLSAQEPTAQQLELLKSLPADIQQQIINETSSSQISKANALVSTENSLSGNNSTPSDPGYFSYEFFNKKSSTNSPVLDIPLQSDYEISFADELFLLLTGGQDESYNLKVDMSGSVLIPNIGSVSLKDMTLMEAEIKLQKIINKLYSGTNSSLSITKAALKKISVIGSVKNPGTFIVNPFISVSEAIKYADGLLPNSSLRNISIARLNGDVVNVDLYNFLVFGDRSADVNLSNGDTLIIGATSNFIRIDGAVQRPGTYEYLKTDKYQSLIDFAQGVIYSADLDDAVLTYINDESNISSKKIILEDTIANIIAQSLYTPTKLFPRNKKIIVKGSDVNDGEFNIEDYQNVEDLIQSLEIGPDIYPFQFKLRQESSDGLKTEFYHLSLIDPSTYEGIKFKSNPELFFYNRYDVFGLTDLSPSLTLSITIGSKTISVPVSGKYSPKDLFDYFGSDGTYNIKNTSVTSSAGVELNAFNKVMNFEPFSSVNIPYFTDNKIKVLIQGEVMYPGEYVVNRNTTLDEIYSIAGGLTTRSNKNAIFLSRQSNKIREKKTYDQIKETLVDSVINSLNNNISGSDITIDLSLLSLMEKPIDNFAGRMSGEIYPGSFPAMNTYLENDDYIFVNPNSNAVSITGEVMSEGTVIFNKDYSIDDYINKVGGYSRLASKKEVYIYKANGESYNMNGALFSKKYRLMPGDTIVVPRNIEKVSILPLYASISQILSNLTLSAASLNAIKN